MRDVVVTVPGSTLTTRPAVIFAGCDATLNLTDRATFRIKSGDDTATGAERGTGEHG